MRFPSSEAAGIFFQNKVDYATWFGWRKDFIHGIQMLPVTPALLLVRTPHFCRQDWKPPSNIEVLMRNSSINMGFNGDIMEAPISQPFVIHISAAKALQFWKGELASRWNGSLASREVLQSLQSCIHQSWRRPWRSNKCDVTMYIYICYPCFPDSDRETDRQIDM